MNSQNTKTIDDFIATMHSTDCAAAREEILLATLKTIRACAISRMVELIIDEALSDHAKFMPEVTA